MEILIVHLHSVCSFRKDFRGIYSSRSLLVLFGDQILEALARNDDLLVQMCGRLSSSCDVIPEETHVRFSALCSEKVEHINRRITNYRKVNLLLSFERK